MAHPRRLWIWLLTLCVGMAACENDAGEVKNLTRKVQQVEVARNIRAVFSQTANIKALLTAPLMYRYKADTNYAEFPESIHVDFYKDDHTLESVVTARYARYFESLNKVFLRDSVVVYNTNFDTLRCQTLWWDQNQDIFYTDDSVTVQTLTQQLRGTGFWARSNLSKYTITNTVGNVALPDNFGDSTAAPADTGKVQVPPVAPAQ